jgi:hypothetical protein
VVSSPLVAETAAIESPGLVAEIVYLRPAPRPPILRAFADLGVFVRERDSRYGEGIVSSSDILVIYGDTGDDVVAALDESLASFGRAILGILPSGSRLTLPQRERLSWAIDDGADGLQRGVRLAANSARTLRRQHGFQEHSSRRVFGSLEFRHSPPELALGGHTAPLSPIEHRVLKQLALSRGRLVPSEDLRRTSPGGETISGGYLKGIVLRIRRKAERLGGDAAMLASVRGYGYVLRG